MHLNSYKNNNEEKSMAVEQVAEKDNLTKIIGGIILVTVIGVSILKGREMEHLDAGASTASTQQAFEAANEKRIAEKNDFY